MHDIVGKYEIKKATDMIAYNRDSTTPHIKYRSLQAVKTPAINAILYIHFEKYWVDNKILL